MNDPNLGESNISETEGQKALVPYNGDRSVVLYQEFELVKKHKPRPKVDLDPETEKTWKLLMGKGGSEGLEETNHEKEKWWEEERNVFHGRVDSFIARMHLIQGKIPHTQNMQTTYALKTGILLLSIYNIYNTSVSLRVIIISIELLIIKFLDILKGVAINSLGREERKMIKVIQYPNLMLLGRLNTNTTNTCLLILTIKINNSNNLTACILKNSLTQRNRNI